MEITRNARKINLNHIVDVSVDVHRDNLCFFNKESSPFNPNYALQTPNNKEQIEKSVSYGVLSSLECSPKRCIPPELKIVWYLKPQGAANFTKSALLSGT